MPQLINETTLPFSKVMERKGKNRNTRTEFDQTKLVELAESIKNNGLIQPVVLRQIVNSQFMLVAGERRTRAMRDVLGWSGYPPGYALIQSAKEGDDAENLSEDGYIVMLAENASREDLNPMDAARAYKRGMDDYGWSAAEAARKAGVSSSTVAGALALLKLAPELQNQVASGFLPMGHGEVMADLPIPLQRAAFRIYLSPKSKWMDKYGLAAECAKLRAAEEMTEQILFAFTEELIEELPTDDGIPFGKKAITPGVPPLPSHLPEPGEYGKRDHIGAIMMRYVDNLLASGLDSEAAAVGAIYRSLVLGKKCQRAIPDSKGGWV